MGEAGTLFVSTFTTLLAIINPFEVMPVFLKLLADQDNPTHRRVARRACKYATMLLFFFLVFGTLLLKIFGVSLEMVRIVGGIILVRIGFSLFQPGTTPGPADAPSGTNGDDVAFVPLAMPLMFGPGAIATVLGMTSLVHQPLEDPLPLVAIAIAILATMIVTYFCLASADRISRRLGPRGLDAATRIVGFFVAAMGMGLIFHGTIDTLKSYGLVSLH